MSRKDPRLGSLFGDLSPILLCLGILAGIILYQWAFG